MMRGIPLLKGCVRRAAAAHCAAIINGTLTSSSSSSLVEAARLSSSSSSSSVAAGGGIGSSGTQFAPKRSVATATAAKATAKSTRASSTATKAAAAATASEPSADADSAPEEHFSFSSGLDDLFSFTNAASPDVDGATRHRSSGGGAVGGVGKLADDDGNVDVDPFGEGIHQGTTATTPALVSEPAFSYEGPSIFDGAYDTSDGGMESDPFLSSDAFTPSLDGSGGFMGFDTDGGGGGTVLSSVSSAASTTPAALAQNPQALESILSSVDMLCDDLYYCKNDVLRSYARTRSIAGRTKGELVLRIIEAANRDAHGESSDLSVTKRVLGDVFSEDIRTSGVRTAWTNKSLEASHIEMACDRHLKFEVMANTQKTLMVRRNAAEGARVLRRLSRTFQQDYDKIATAATGGVFRTYRAETDHLVSGAPVAEIVSPFAAFLVSYVRFGSSANLLTRTNVNEKLTHLEVMRPDAEEATPETLQELMRMLDQVVKTVERRQGAFGEKKTHWGQETADVLVAEAQAFSEASHDGWNTELAPSWVHDLARMFNNWEVIVRTDLPTFEDAPRYFFDCILTGVINYHLISKVYRDIIVPTDISIAVRVSLKRALERHFNDEEKASNAIQELLGYVQAGGEVRGGVRGNFFISVLSQMQGAFHDSDHSVLQSERVAVILREVCTTASRCTRSCGLEYLLVKLTEDLRFHFRFQAIYRRLSGPDRKTIRNKLSINMINTLEYFESEFSITPISTKAVCFLVIQLVYLSMKGTGDGRRPVLERFASCLQRPDLGLVGLSEVEATQVRDLRVAFPPQLSYNSWLNESDTKEKSVYNVLPSVAVKGATNQAMIISQAPMMKALDAISRVPWRINKYMLHVQEAIVREGFGFGKIRSGFYPLHYTALSRGDIKYMSTTGAGMGRGGGASSLGSFSDRDDDDDNSVFTCNLTQRRDYDMQQNEDWKELAELRSSRIHYLQALRQARSIVQFSHIYFPNSMDFRGRMYPLPGRLNHTGSDPFRALLEYSEPKPLGKVGLYWLKVHVANKMGMTKLSFDERVHYVDEHIEDVVNSAESPLNGDRWWQEGGEPLQCLMACKELADALKFSQGTENFLSRVPVAVDGSYNGLQHYSAIGRDAFGASLVNLVPSDRPADAYTGILKEMMKSIEVDAARDNQVAQRCIGTGKGQDHDHIKRKTIKRPIMTQVYGVTGYGMSEQILDELVKQNKSHGLWTITDMKEMAGYLREKVLESLGVTFRETQNCRKWISEVSALVWSAQPAELRNALCWTTPLGLVVRQPYKVRKECPLFTAHGFTKVPGDSVAPASRKQLTAIAPNLIHSLDATHLAMTALEMQSQGLSMMAVHDSYWTYACDLPDLSRVLREQFVALYSKYDPLWELKEQWEEAYFMDLRRHGIKLPDPPKRGELDLKVVLDSAYFFS